jgi:hypothetical protein
MKSPRSTLKDLSFPPWRNSLIISGRSLGMWPWGKNLDAFNDVLRGGFGTPDEGFILRWHDHEISKHRLGYEETVRQLQMRLGRCHSTNRDRVAKELDAALRHEGPTVFDWLVEIISAHCPGGDEQEDNIQLILQ